MDSSIRTETRFRLVAEDLGVSFKELIGCVYLAWLNCYERRTTCLSKREADASAEQTGFSDAMIANGLADDLGAQGVAFHGVEKRIEFLREQKEKGRKGGRKSGRARKLGHKANAEANAEANGSGAAQAYSPSPSPSPTLSLAHDLLESIRRQWPTSVTGQKQKPPASWSRAIGRLLKTQTEQDIADTIAWLETGQPSGCGFVVQSADALAEKWDRIQAVRSKSLGPKPLALDFGGVGGRR